jgi:hypothetical protein
LPLDTDNVAVDAHVNAFVLEEVCHSEGDILVLACD